MVVDEATLRPVERGSGVIGRLATRGRVPLGYHKDPERSARTFVEIDGERWSLPGDMATIDADGTIHLLGRRVAAVITTVDGVAAPDLESLQAHCRAHLAGYKVPRVLRVVGDIPRSP